MALNDALAVPAAKEYKVIGAPGMSVAGKSSIL